VRNHEKFNLAYFLHTLQIPQILLDNAGLPFKLPK